MARKSVGFGPDLASDVDDAANEASVRLTPPTDDVEARSPKTEICPCPDSLELRGTMVDVSDGQSAPPLENELLKRLPHLVRRERELAVARLASTLTHTLGTPLQVIAGRATLARKTTSREELDRHLEIIQRKCSEITALLWRVLDSLRVEQPKAFERVALGPFFGELLAELGSVGVARGVRWDLVLSDDGAGLDGLKLRREDLRQALLSLGLGVLAEAPDGSRLRVTVDKAEDEVRGLTPVHEVMLRVTFQRGVSSTSTPRASGEQASGDVSAGTEVARHVTEPWLHADGTRVDGQAIGWAATYELARSNEGRLDVSDQAVTLSWPAVP